MAIDCQHSWYRRHPPSGSRSPDPVVEDPGPAPHTEQVPSQENPVDPVSQQDDAAAEASAASLPPGTVTLLSGDQPSRTPASAVLVQSQSEDTFVPSVSDSVLGQILSESVGPTPSVSDSALAEVDMPSVPADPPPSVPDSALAQVEILSPSGAPASDLATPDEKGDDENSDDDDMGDSAEVVEAQQLAWKRVSRKKGQQRNLTQKATASRSFAPVCKATRPNPPGARPKKGKDPPE